MWTIALSFVLHLPVLLGLPVLLETDDGLQPTEFDAQREFELTFVSPDQDTPNRVDEELDGQFVSQKRPERSERPEEARYLDQYDSAVEEETARRAPGDEKLRTNAGGDTPGMPAQPSRPTHRPKRTQELKAARPEQQATEKRETAESASKEVSPAEARESDQSVDLEETTKAAEGLVQNEESNRSKPNPQRLFPSLENIPSGSLGGGSLDYLRDVKDGEKTLLNRKQSRYWSFMHRMKIAVMEKWSPAETYRQRDPHGKVYGVKDRYTNLLVVLNGDGSLRTIRVEKSSGLDFYDEEAVRAFSEAAPFPNPPEGLKDRDGIIHIRFGFLLNIHTGEMRGLRIFR